MEKVFATTNKVCKNFLTCKTKNGKVFATTNKVCKSFDIKSDKPENLKIKRFCKCKLQTGKKVFAKWENSFDKHKNSNLISHLKLKRQTQTSKNN